MKVIAHIKNDGYMCHEAISAELELSCPPALGDIIFFGPERKKELENKITKFTQRQLKRNPDCSPYYCECTNDKGEADLDDYFYCVTRNFRHVEGNRYELHIEIGDSTQTSI